METKNILFKRKINILINILLILLSILLQKKTYAQDYQQLLVTEDNKNAIIKIKRLPVSKSTIPFEIKVIWVDKNLKATQVKDAPRIILGTDNIHISPNAYLKLVSKSDYIYFTDKTILNFKFDKNQYKGGNIQLNLNLFYLNKEGVTTLKSTWKNFFFRKPEQLIFKTFITKNQLTPNPKLLVQFTGADIEGGETKLMPGQTAILTFKLNNTGNAKTDKIRINISEESKLEGLEFKKYYEINALGAGEHTVFKIPVKAKYTLKKGNAFFNVRFLYSEIKKEEQTTCELSTRSDYYPPVITIIKPLTTRGFQLAMENNNILIEGKVTDNVAVAKLKINNTEIEFDDNGYFSYSLILNQEINKAEIKAWDFADNTSTEIINLSYLKPKPESDNSFGTYYALIIANNQYDDPAIISLDEPIKDAEKLYKTLTTKYTFEPQNVKILKNGTYVDIIQAFDELSNQITPNDNLLIFYSGHGWWDDKKKLGYWLPVDAKKSNTAFWIRNSTISDYMGSINSKHTLLIADACFSGSIFKTKRAFNQGGAIEKLYQLPSRKAMTSGNLKEVPDKSMFLYYLVKSLNENQEKFISSDVLFSNFRIAVMNNSNTEPQYGTIRNTGDEGGEFIFIKR